MAKIKIQSTRTPSGYIVIDAQQFLDQTAGKTAPKPAVIPPKTTAQDSASS